MVIKPAMVIKRKKKKRRSPVDLRLEALEIRMGELERLFRPLSYQITNVVGANLKMSADYKAIGDLKQLIGDLDLTMFAVFHSTRDLLTYMQKGASKEAQALIDRPVNRSDQCFNSG